jgi:hypothetical protein
MAPVDIPAPRRPTTGISQSTPVAVFTNQSVGTHLYGVYGSANGTGSTEIREGNIVAERYPAP